jgi:YD repeat-containing protein
LKPLTTNSTKFRTRLSGRQRTLNYTWDNANRLTQIAQGGSTVGFNYDNANRRTTLTLPNGVAMAYTYDNDSRVSGITYTAGSTQLGNLTYAYDAAGRRTSSGGSLAAVTLPSAVGASSIAYNADNEQIKFGSAASMSYDNDGELKSDGTNTYTWDARRHLTAMSGGATASFVYDAFGRRMKKTIGSTVTQFVYDRLNPVQELNGATPPGVTANLLTGLGIDEYFTRTASSATSTLLADALGCRSSVGPIINTFGFSFDYGQVEPKLELDRHRGYIAAPVNPCGSTG